jgi:hypothetical protein
MAVRRLVAVLLLLLAISTLAAALAPQRPARDRGQAQTRPQTIDPPPAAPGPPRGRLVRARMNTSSGVVRSVRLRVGDQLLLDVLSRESDQVEIPVFGVVEAVSRDGPARLDLLATTAGTFPVRMVEADRVVGRLVVRRR